MSMCTVKVFHYFLDSFGVIGLSHFRGVVDINQRVYFKYPRKFNFVKFKLIITVLFCVEEIQSI